MIIWVLIFSCIDGSSKWVRFESYNCGLFSIFCFPKTMTFVLSSSSFTFLPSKPRFFVKKCFAFAVICSSVSSFTRVMPSTIMQALRWYCWRLSTSCSRRLLAFLVTSSTPSNSSTLFSSISILAVSDFIVSSSCRFAFGVTGVVFFAGVESVFFCFFLSCVHFSCG